MQFPKLTPLQSRFAASLVASAILVIVYLTLSPHHFAYAAELDSLLQDDHNHHRLDALLHAKLLEELDLDGDEGGSGEEHVGYEAEFIGVSRDIIGRAEAGVDALFNNVVNQMDIDPGLTHNYVFSKEQVFGNHTDPGAGLPSALESRSISLDEHKTFLLEPEELAEDEFGEEDEGRYMRRLASRQAQQTVYISINTCQQPVPNGTVSGDPPQLTLYVSTSESNQKPGPDSTNGLATEPIPLQGGFANYTFNATGDVYIGVSAPTLPSNFSGNWHFEVAASIDGLYYRYNGDTPFLFFVDSDISSALFVTDNLTNANSSPELDQQWLELGTPFTMYAFGQNNTAIKGLENSLCGLRQLASVEKLQVTAGMTTRGMGNKPKEQFYIQGLNGSSTYYGFLAMIGNGTTEGPGVPDGAVVGGGGQVWQAMNFTTKADENCQVIFNLTFCNEVAYAVPANPTKWNVTGLSSLYDTQAEAYYQNFTYSLQQIACNTTNTAQYSLARNCTDCALDYKNWLCAVQIPRCEDFSSTLPYLQPRNVAANFINGSSPDPNSPYSNVTLRERLYANRSRNPLIDQTIQPGPYKEVLPCDDLCYSIVQSCPAKLQFGCPQGPALDMSYGRRSADPGQITCSYLGAVYYLNESNRGSGSGVMAVGAAIFASLAALFLG
ncbi:hypothetical protein AOQ84DRAFT_436826 [Glonium stellatum]|uniref:Uncharacterized protein n=1 Tax=Glonium stellatum TaxID=574774 RepID=A0A8E2JWX3_9PEZI|nr:hypothetical protein AOQ84DRAFT_436826 [Glonium stellatum]